MTVNIESSTLIAEGNSTGKDVYGPRGDPDVTVVIPTRNAAHHIGETVASFRSALRQTDRAFEILVVDDASDDATALALAQLLRTHVELRVLRLERRAGKGGAVLAGIRTARGENLLFADDDMVLGLDTITRLLREIDKGADLVNGDRGERHGDGALYAAPRAALRALFRRCTPCCVEDTTSPVKCVRKTVFDEIDHHPYMLDMPHEYAVITAMRPVEVPVAWQSARRSSSRYTAGLLVREFLILAWGLTRMAIWKRKMLPRTRT